MKSRALQLAKDLSLSIDAATQTFAFLGRKGSGKSYAVGKLVELLLEAGVQVVILDTVGNWYGLRLGADGKSAGGFDIALLGGLRGDIPIEENSGELIAKTLVETGRSAIIDVSQFSLGARQRFATAFGETLWSAKKRDAHPRPLHLVFEESQLIVPQRVRPEQGRMVGIYEEIIRLGRNYGIGVSMVSQRPQSVNKEVLNQTECLFVFQTSGKQERDALKDWIVAQGVNIDLLKELPSLPAGTGYVWSPQWLQTFERVTVLKKRTFDSTATPKVGDKRVSARALPPLDLADLETQMKSLVERAKQDDPKLLRKRIAVLEREALELGRSIVEKKKPYFGTLGTMPPPEPVPAVSEEDRAELIAITKAHEALGKRLAGVALRIGKTHKRVGGRLLSVPIMTSEAVPKDSAVIVNQGKVVNVRNVGKPTRAEGTKLSKGERKVLTALAQYTQGRTKKQLALLCVYAIDGGGFSNILSSLRTRGYLVGGLHGDTLYRITDEGVAALGTIEPLPTGTALLAHWQAQLGKAERLILTALSEAFPDPIDKAELAARTGYEASGGGFGNAISRLRTLELIEGRAGLRASEELMTA